MLLHRSVVSYLYTILRLSIGYNFSWILLNWHRAPMAGEAFPVQRQPDHLRTGDVQTVRLAARTPLYSMDILWVHNEYSVKSLVKGIHV